MTTPSAEPDLLPLPTLDKLLIILCHLSWFLGVGLLLPFVVWLVKKSEHDRVFAHAQETLNAHLTWVLIGIGCALLSVIGIGVVLVILLGFAVLVLGIVGAVKAANGVLYRYPLTWRLVG